MAPTNERAVATVFSAQVVTPDEKSILVEAGGFTPMRSFLQYAASTRVEDAEPPKKRRKTKGASDVASIASNKDDDALIPIHTVTLDLHFPETLTTKAAHGSAVNADVDFADSEKVPVLIHGIGNGDTSSMLRLDLPGKVDALLRVEASAVAQSVVDALRAVGKPRDAHSEGRYGTHPATVFRCTLAQSAGQLYTVVRLEATMYWRSGISAFKDGAPTRKPWGKAIVCEDFDILTQTYPNHGREEMDHSQAWTAQDFYGSVYTPPKGSAYVETNGVLETDLYPFQRRAVTWMLRREGVLHDAQLKPISKGERQQDTVDLYETVKDARGETCYVNYLTSVITRQKPESCHLSGGLLAEEMGLGKTVELMALILLHKRAEIGSCFVRDGESGTTRSSRATLIITPNSILQQWKSELSRHAPALKVKHYTGIPSSHSKSESDDDIVEDLSTYDVVLATYHTLGGEVHFAEKPPERNMRHKPKYDRRKSPLVRIQWWRVCLDEAQMVESGVTAAARVACRLPRVHSWAVSGTPLRKTVDDLHGLLIFLRYKPFNDNPKLWRQLVTNHKNLFRRLFGAIALRHTKAQIREELHLPLQKRVVITVPFSAVESQNYATLYNQMCEEVGLTNDGAPRDDDWDPDHPDTLQAMRGWLVRLRQTCLHPQVGGRNRKALGRGQGPLRTVAEVLEVMIEQNESNTRVDERALLSAQLQRAHILCNNREDDHRSEKGLEIYKQAVQASAVLVTDARVRLAAAKATIAEKGEAATDTESEESDSESTAILGRLRNNLRTALQLQHACTFFAATACFQLKSNEELTEPESERFQQLEEQETSLYESAKQLRKEIMVDTSRKADNLMRKVRDLESQGGLTVAPTIRPLTSLGGIESRRLVEKSDVLFDVITEQSKHIRDWRSKMAEYLLKPLVDKEEEMETTGDEYEDSTKQQDELYVSCQDCV